MSTLVVSNISDGTTTVGASYVTNGSAKAWVNFNGTGTIAARDSLNLSSLTDNGTGDYTVNFSNAMGNSSYCVIGDAQSNNLSFPLKNTGIHTLAVGSARSNYGSGSSESGLQDMPTATLLVSGDLA